MFLVGWMLLYYGEKVASPSAEMLLKYDRRSPVVYLRAFLADSRERSESDLPADQPNPTTFTIGRYIPLIGFFVLLRNLVRMFLGIFDQRLEEELARAFRRTGPFISIGQPGERFATRGAARMYLSAEQWEGVVADFILRAQVVLWQAETTPGVLWELQKIRELMNPKRLIVFIPDPAKRSEEYLRIRKILWSILPHPLPETPESANFVVFDEDWRPTLLPFRLIDPIEAQLYSSSLDLRGTFGPFIDRLQDLDDARLSHSRNFRTMALPIAMSGLRRLNRALAVLWIVVVPYAFLQYSGYRSRFERSCGELTSFAAALAGSVISSRELFELHQASLVAPKDLVLPFRHCGGKTREEWEQMTHSFGTAVHSAAWTRLIAEVRTLKQSYAEAEAVVAEFGNAAQKIEWQRMRSQLQRELREKSYLVRFAYNYKDSLAVLLDRERFESGLAAVLRQLLFSSRVDVLASDSVTRPDSMDYLGIISIDVALQPRTYPPLGAPAGDLAPSEPVASALRMQMGVVTRRGRSSWDGPHHYEVAVELPDADAVRSFTDEDFNSLRRDAAGELTRGLVDALVSTDAALGLPRYARSEAAAPRGR
jgi:hypothetical protein